MLYPEAYVHLTIKGLDKQIFSCYFVFSRTLLKRSKALKDLNKEELFVKQHYEKCHSATKIEDYRVC